MNLIGNTWANLAEMVVNAVESGTASRSVACAAWWLGSQSILGDAAFWRQAAAFATSQLPEAEQDIIKAQLKPDEIALITATLEWPAVPETISTTIAGWWPAAATDAATKAKYAGLLAQAMNATAREYGYDSITTAVTYRGDPNATFAAEGEAFFQWRSAVWQYGIAELAAVTSGATLPTTAAFVAGIPAFTLGTGA
ncbi:hypothetical protein [Ciceribacter thiooxidans]|uniref:Uncharacterized protein n=1 Tax=Ciceribacter thiooxidans TaxID=1969821 RepID=A0ABV7HXF0_9HYPH